MINIYNFNSNISNYLIFHKNNNNIFEINIYHSFNIKQNTIKNINKIK